jgi:ABC-type uncharacterized transport system substrate-binding protein
MDLAKVLLTQPFPERPVHVGVIYSTYPASVSDVDKMQAVADQEGRIVFERYQLEYLPLSDGLESMLTEVRKGIAALSSKVDYWWIVPGPLGESTGYYRLLLDSAVPVGLCYTADCCRDGGLFFVGPDNTKSGRQVASMVDLIIKGTPSGDIPPVVPDSFNLGVNLKTAIHLGIVVPSQYLQLAGENIWR